MALILLLFLLIGSENAIASSEMVMAGDTDRIKEQSEYIKCTFSKMDRKLRLEAVPWKRAQHGTKNGIYDGFFLASKNDIRDKYANLSDGFYDIEWLYVVKKDNQIALTDPNFYKQTFSSVLGSNRLMWLKKELARRGITRKIVVKLSSTKVLELLERDRIDVDLENNINLENSFKATGLNPSNFTYFVIKSYPVGAYFSKNFLKREPDFLEKFNKAVKICKKK